MTTPIVHCLIILPTSSQKLIKSINDLLNLNTTLRSHLAEITTLGYSIIIEQIEPAVQRQRGFNQGFDMYITADIEAAKLYISGKIP